MKKIYNAQSKKIRADESNAIDVGSLDFGVEIGI